MEIVSALETVGILVLRACGGGVFVTMYAQSPELGELFRSTVRVMDVARLLWVGLEPQDYLFVDPSLQSIEPAKVEFPFRRYMFQYVSRYGRPDIVAIEELFRHVYTLGYIVQVVVEVQAALPHRHLV